MRTAALCLLAVSAWGSERTPEPPPLRAIIVKQCAYTVSVTFIHRDGSTEYVEPTPENVQAVRDLARVSHRVQVFEMSCNR